MHSDILSLKESLFLKGQEPQKRVILHYCKKEEIKRSEWLEKKQSSLKISYLR